MVAHKDLPFEIQVAPTSRSHCTHEGCEASKQGGEFIKQGCIRVKEYKTSPRGTHYYCLAPNCVSQELAKSMLEEYNNKCEDVPGMSALSDEQREAAMTVLTAIHKGTQDSIKEEVLTVLQTPDTSATPSKKRKGKGKAAAEEAQEEETAEPAKKKPTPPKKGKKGAKGKKSAAAAAATEGEEQEEQHEEHEQEQEGSDQEEQEEAAATQAEQKTQHTAAEAGAAIDEQDKAGKPEGNDAGEGEEEEEEEAQE